MKMICVLFAIIFLAAISSRAADVAPGASESNLFVSSSTIFLAEVNFIEPMAYQGYVCVVSTQGGNLNIRSIPSTSGRIVGKLANGRVVREVGVRNDWSKIAVSTSSGRTGRVLGWVLSSYLNCGE